jgi:LPS sulfotransferase NodH
MEATQVRGESFMHKRRYLIVGIQRSGTTVLHLALKGHPNVAALNDELKVAPLFTQGIRTFTFGNDTEEEKRRGHAALFDALTSITEGPDTVATGAKCACGSPALARVLVDSLQKHFAHVRIILATRRNLVAQFGSLLAAERSGVWHSWNPEFAGRRPPEISMNRWAFTHYVHRCLDTHAVLQGLHETHSVLTCEYEDYLKDPAAIHSQLFDFVGVPQRDVTWLESMKLVPRPEEYISNYAAMSHLLERVRDDYAGTGIRPGSRALASVIGGAHGLATGLLRYRRSRKA